MSVCEAIGCEVETVSELCIYHLKNDLAAKRNDQPRVPRKEAGEIMAEPEVLSRVGKQEGKELRCSRCGRAPSEVSVFIKKSSLCHACDQAIKKAAKAGRKVAEYKPKKKHKTPAKKEATLLPRAASPGGAETRPSDDKEPRREPSAEGGSLGEPSLTLTIDFKDHRELYDNLLAEASEELRTPDMQLIWFLRTLQMKGTH